MRSSVFFSSLELRPQPEVPFDTTPQKLWLCALLRSAITHQLCGVANVYLIGGRTFSYQKKNISFAFHVGKMWFAVLQG